MLSNLRFLVILVGFCFLSIFCVELSDRFNNDILIERTMGHNKGITLNNKDFSKLPVKYHIERNKQIKKVKQPSKSKTQTKPPIKTDVKMTENPLEYLYQKFKNGTKDTTQKSGLEAQTMTSAKGKDHKKKEEKSLMEKMLPMMVTPFLVSSSMVPMMMMSLIHMLIKSAIIGKIGLILMMINMFSNRRNPGGVSHHEIDTGNHVSKEYYGWHGDEEYGAYIHQRR